MIDRGHELSVTRQAQMLNLSRSSVYYLPRPVSPGDLALMRRIDELHLDYPFAGARMLRDLLGREGFAVGRLHISSLMKRMGIEAIYRRPNTSKPAPGQGLSLPAAQAGSDPAQSGLGDGYYLYPHGPRLCLPDGGRGLVQPQGSGLAGIDQHGCELLH